MKELLQDLKRELLSSFGNSESEAINEMKRYKKSFPAILAIISMLMEILCLTIVR